MKTKNLLQKSIPIAILLAIFATSAAFSQTPLPSPKQEKLLNGLKILMWSDAKADKVSVKIRIHSGSAFDPQGREGLMQMLADNIFPNEASREFFAEDLGGGLEIVTNYDYIQINASSKPEFFLQMVETLSTAVSNPVIDKETTAKLQTAQLKRLAAMEVDPAYIADRAVAKRLFGTFPYGRPQLGTAESIRKIDFADLIDAKARFLTADSATVTVSGSFDQSLAFKAVRRYFGGWLKADKKVPSTFKQPDQPLAVLLTVDSPVQGVTELRFAVRGVGRRDKELAASKIVSAVIDGRLRKLVPAQYSKDMFVRNEPHTLPGSIIFGFTVRSEDRRAEKSDAGGVMFKAFAGNVTEAEFAASRDQLASDLGLMDAASLWLDNDTYQTGSVDLDRKAASNVTLGDVNTYLEKFRKLPIASVAVLSAPKSAK